MFLMCHNATPTNNLGLARDENKAYAAGVPTNGLCVHIAVQFAAANGSATQGAHPPTRSSVHSHRLDDSCSALFGTMAKISAHLVWTEVEVPEVACLQAVGHVG